MKWVRLNNDFVLIIQIIKSMAFLVTTTKYQRDIIQNKICMFIGPLHKKLFIVVDIIHFYLSYP